MLNFTLFSPLFFCFPFLCSFLKFPFYLFLYFFVRKDQLHEQLRTAKESVQEMQKIGQIQVFDQLFDELFDLRAKSGTARVFLLPLSLSEMATDSWQQLVCPRPETEEVKHEFF